MKISRYRAMGLGMLAAVIPSTGLFAVPVTFTFSGTVQSVSSSLMGPGGFTVGDSITGSYTFESTSGPSFVNNVGGGSAAYYDQSLASFTLQIGGYIATSPKVTILVENNMPTDFDQYRVITGWFDGLSGPDVGGLQLSSFSMILIDPTQTAFNSTALPQVPPSMPAQSFHLFFNRDVPQAQVAGGISSITAASVPDSLATGLFLLVTVAPVMALHRRRDASGAG